MSSEPLDNLTESITLLIAAPYATTRAGLRALLANALGIEIIGEVANLDEFESSVQAQAAHVVILDSSMLQWQTTLDVLDRTDTSVVVLSDDRSAIDSLQKCNLRGWALLLPEADSEAIVGAIQAAGAGLIVLDRALASRIQRSDLENTASPAALPNNLTLRESEVLQLMAEGLPNKQIAARLEVSAHTVKFHVASILSKLEASSRAEAVAVGARRGYLLL